MIDVEPEIPDIVEEEENTANTEVATADQNGDADVPPASGSPGAESKGSPRGMCWVHIFTWWNV